MISASRAACVALYSADSSAACQVGGHWLPASYHNLTRSFSVGRDWTIIIAVKEETNSHNKAVAMVTRISNNGTDRQKNTRHKKGENC